MSLAPTPLKPITPVVNKPIPKPTSNSGIINLGSGSSALNPVNSNSIGVKTKSPMDSLKSTPNTTNQPKVQTPGSTKSTENGTQGTPNTGVKTQGGAVIDPKTGALITAAPQPEPGTPGAPAPTPTPTPTSAPTPSPYQASDAGLYGKLIAEMANRSAQSGKDYNNAQAEAKGYLDQQTQLEKEYQDKKMNINGTAGFLTQASGLQGQLADKYNAVGAKLASNYSGATNRINAANSQQGLLQSLLQGAASGAAPQAYSLYNQPYNPASDTYGGGGASGATDRAVQAANIGTAGDFAKDYQTGLANLRTADGIQSQIVDTLKSNPDINNQPLSLLTNLNQYLSGQLGSAPQQLLAQQVNSYISTLGLDPASVVNIATQQKGTLAQLLDSLRQTAETKNESKNPANIKGGTSGTPSSGSNSSGSTSTTSVSGANPWH